MTFNTLKTKMLDPGFRRDDEAKAGFSRFPMSEGMDEEPIKRWTARRKSALAVAIRDRKAALNSFTIQF